MNRLAAESSPYLLQHKDNPIHWVPWGSEAFARAISEDKPIFLSVGYSSCHWCHVMAHESFESEAVAAILNENYVSIKVDREERPDVDEAYMAAVQLASGRGGWPMTIFMTPSKEPFFAGTYFPREDRRGQPGFLTLCRQIAGLWRTRRSEVVAQAKEFASELRQALGRGAYEAASRFDQDFVDRAAHALSEAFDEVDGGFGGAPKFPPHTAIDFLLRYSATTSDQDLKERARHMALFTLEKMALGGIHDHVGGGFHRYSTDADWRLPHFEKMLYDNALMLANYANARDAARGSAIAYGLAGLIHWLGREMATSDGCYASALDADSDGGEGNFYRWTVRELRQILGEGADAFIDAFSIEREGNVADEATGRKTGVNVLIRREAERNFAPELEKLRQAREMRPRPLRDDKSIVAWNGLVISALSAQSWADAERTAEGLLEAETRHGRLPHLVIGGIPSADAFLDDFAALSVGLFRLAEARRLHDADRSKLWRRNAERLTQQMIEQFWDETAGGFFASSAHHEELFGRTKPVFDQPIPSGNALALQCLIEVGDYERAWALLDWALGWMERAPHATEALYAAALPLLRRRRESREVEAMFTLAGREGEVLLRIPRGIHVNGHFIASPHLIPTSVEAENATIDYPAGELYIGEVQILVKFHSDPKPITLHYQACTESECLRPTRLVLIATSPDQPN